MRRRRLEVSGALLLCIAIAIGGFLTLSDALRTVEVDLVRALLRLGTDRVAVLPGHTFQVLPPSVGPFRAHVTPFCSSLVSLLAMGSIGIFVLHGPLWRRLAAFLAASVFVLVCNVIRIGGSLAVGLHYGDRSLVLFHDWVGTLFGLGYTVAGFFFMLWLLLPSAKDTNLVRAARVSDVL